MLRYYFSIYFKNLLRNKLHTLVGVIGLSIGFTSAFLIGLYIKDELTFERWIPNYNQIFRVDSIDSNQGIRYNAGPADLGRWFVQDFPQLEGTVRTAINRRAVSLDDRESYELITWADENFFDIFDINVVLGSLSEALSGPDGIVISRSIAEKYFGSEDPIGKQLTFSRQTPMTINAVIEDPPSNTHLILDIIAPSHAPSSFLAAMDQSPLSGAYSDTLWSTQTYVRLGFQDTPNAIEQALPEMLDRRVPLPNRERTSETYVLDLLPIADIHLTPANTNQSGAELGHIYTLVSIAVLILLSASINYINLMTANGQKRAKEIAIRKTLGANQSNIFYQFMTESLLYVCISCLLATLLTTILIGPINTFLDRSMEIDLLADKSLILGILLIGGLTTFAAGFYPSVLLSNYSPSMAFKANKPQKDSTVLRLSLVTIQFSILSGLLISTIAISAQARFAISESLGSEDSPIINISSACNTAFEQSLRQLTDVHDVTCSASIPQLGINYDTSISRPDIQDNEVRILYSAIDAGFLEFYGLEMVAGRDFDENRTGDFSPQENVWNIPEPIIINETAARRLEFDSPAAAVGSVLKWTRFYNPDSLTPEHDAIVIGIVKDFQIGSIREGIQPAAFFADPNWSRQVSVKIDGANIVQALAEIDNVWSTLDNRGPISRNFYNDSIEAMYQSMVQQAQLAASYSAVAFCISIFGLMSLAIFELQKRTKEIGIRKVLGGTKRNIFGMFISDFSKPQIVGIILSWPITYYILTRWLEGYQRHVELGIWMFLGSTLIILVISLVFIAAHSLRASSMNPVSLLRYE